ncbi:hypothetical protein COCC4DRAFT_150198 [Bipolaris maydis ATCC 48331]|uniref:Zn(2)-C6 fungal-type domain-containing protein n=2 Tax=Cochliobolus heterostrophus TaxID=5016 RepID=M2VA34_COCH5|nr:uncharacterized protein COCC4DRAFT_150198 [Bipolaris maydis ATCC 48331]EMD96583.1 hypothetical protein COCHEDRAFT_1208504 [Bipolaris maydis C5]ENI00590.1 hypothetical protein COCC4DRAFT_150198 [Bipolaris maydis ATCC 48331]KAJ5031530.1 hypothetical protein J3E73DRAFT_252507 [Bipolaris maydis]KAJ6273616.1 hypothetical protein PSV08DRAFT_348625 [Bipolaris maydis]
MSSLGSTPQQPVDSGPTISITSKRVRAKHACHECHARRFKCNVTQCHPCSNCESAGTQCELFPSRRGRYDRPPKRQVQRDALAQTDAIPGVQVDELFSVSFPSVSVTHDITPDEAPEQNEDESITGASTTNPSQGTSTTAQETLLYGESNPLTLIPESVRPGEQLSSEESHP